MLTTYLTTAMVVISLVALAVRLGFKNYVSKSWFTMAALLVLSILAIIQAIMAKIPSVSAAWTLLIVIFVVLMVSTCMSYSKWEKEFLFEETDEEYVDLEKEQATKE